MVRRTEGTMPDQRCAGWSLVRYGIDAGHIQRLFDVHGRQYTGHGTRQRSFPSARGANRQYVMDEKPYAFQYSFCLKFSVYQMHIGKTQSN